MISTQKYFESDLNKVTTIMEKDFKLRAGHLNDFMERSIETTKEMYYPFLLLATFRLLSSSKEPPYHMVAVIHFINMATNIHKYEGQHPQYPVLIGDYIYSKFFSYLCKYHSLNWLHSLSDVICKIHEGQIERRQNHQNGINVETETLKKEVAYLSAVSCEIGAFYAQSSDLVTKTMKEIGLNFGMAWALSEEYSNADIKGFPTSKIRIYLEKAHKMLLGLSNNFVNNEMITVFDEIIYKLDNNALRIRPSKVV